MLKVQELLKEAVSYVFNRAHTGLAREAKDYEVDYAKLMEYRQRIREALERLGKAP